MIVVVVRDYGRARELKLEVSTMVPGYERGRRALLKERPMQSQRHFRPQAEFEAEGFAVLGAGGGWGRQKHRASLRPYANRVT